MIAKYYYAASTRAQLSTDSADYLKRIQDCKAVALALELFFGSITVGYREEQQTRPTQHLAAKAAK